MKLATGGKAINPQPATGNYTQQLLRLMAPLIAGNILQQLYNTIDVAVIARCSGQTDFAAVGVAGSVMNLFLFIVAGACSGLAIVLAQLYGAEQWERFRQAHFLSLTFGLALTAMLTLAGLLSLRGLLALIRTPSELIIPAEQYLCCVLLALPATYLYNLYSGMFRSTGHAALPMLILAVATALNFALDIWFIAGMRLGAYGAALATAIAQVFSALASLAWLCLRARNCAFRRENCRMDAGLLGKLGHYALVTGFHQCGLYIGKLLVQGAVNTGGAGLVMAFTAAVRLEGFANSFGDSGSVATSIVTARHYGAGEKECLPAIFRSSLRLMGAIGITMAAVMFAFAEPLLRLVMGAPDPFALAQAVRYLRVISAFYLFCYTGGAFVGYFDGIGRITVSMAGAVGHITLRVILSWLLVSRFQLTAIAIATGIGWMIANITWIVVQVLL